MPEFEATEVLWALHPDAWKKGYATETARAALDYGFRDLDLDLIFAITKPDNDPSRAVSDWNDIRLLLEAAREQKVTLDWALLEDYLRLFHFEAATPPASGPAATA